MTLLLVIVGLVTTVVAVSVVARRLGALAPILLVVVGLAFSFVAAVPQVRLDPEIVLIGVLPPLLYVAAVETSVPAFRYNLRPILLLAVGLVIFTTAAVGYSLHLLLPDVPLAATMALGAIVAPPDAVAATAVARRIGLPRRVVAILEGESLVNDATALVLFRVAVAAATGHILTPLGVTGDALIAAVGGVAIGGTGAVVLAWVHRRVHEPLIDNAVSLLAPWLVYLPAEQVHASGVVAVVVTGLYLGHRYPTLMSAASRLQMEAFWRMLKFLLEGIVFLLVGLQLRFIVHDLATNPDIRLGLVVNATLAVLAVVVAARFVWMYPATYLTRLVPRVRRRDPAPPMEYPTILAWTGMRGVVTLAAALALPPTLAGGRPYPRDLFVWLAFSVIVGTLVLQGVTLPAIVRWLRIPRDDPKRDALAEATVQQAATRAAHERLDKEADRDGEVPEAVLDRLRTMLTDRSNLAWERLGGRRRETPSEAYSRLRLAMIDAERDVFRLARDEGRIPEEVLRRAQRDMDLEESLLQRED
ncbi:Na+/H+ antiporter [Planosporangium mesophilum]|uniref:Na+/H+ antiporter n=1 Tax=Planosporangium mesophilum TaxID=689768 RepID=A0A8J3TAK2_9ACTN|nr:Na+/H+ antiporter [Planosporangium mesophilum]NJC86133.1 Na+/H+ antiporter [Planosporangium mesophilum]GII23018.1 Na+/H+ antiporter [Planosporangium mesophilum]